MPKKLIRHTVIISFLVFSSKVSLFGSQNELTSFNSVAIEYDGSAEKRFHTLKKLFQEAQGLNEKDQLVRVNDFFNQIPYSSDQKSWKETDYWATPSEFLSKGRGDCEDFAIAKFFALLELGIPKEKLFLTYAVIDNLTQRHMVLAYYEYDGAIPLILDNRTLSIDPESMNHDYIPLYRFNLNNFITYDKDGEHKSPLASKKMYKWEELTKRL